MMLHRYAAQCLAMLKFANLDHLQYYSECIKTVLANLYPDDL